MIGKRRRDRRRQARAAIERYEQQARSLTYQRDGAQADAASAQAREIEANADREQALQRLADANAELRRWGLEPITRDEPYASHAPQRYRRHSDWRTTRSGDQLTELLERSVTCSPPDVEISVDTSAFPDLEGPVLLTHVPGCLFASGHGGPCHVSPDQPASNVDLVDEIRGILEDTRAALLDRELNPRGLIHRTRDALERMRPDDPMAIVSGDVHLGLARALADQGEAAHAMRLELRACEAERDAARASDVDARAEVQRLQVRIGAAHAAGWLEGAGTMSTGEEGLGLAAPWPERAAALRRQRDALTEQLDDRTAECDRLRAERDALIESLPARTLVAETELSRVRAELADALTAANAAEGDADRLSPLVQERQTEIERLERVNDRLRGELSAVRLELERLEAAIGTAPTELQVGQVVRVTVDALLPPVWLRVAEVEPGDPGQIVRFERES